MSSRQCVTPPSDCHCHQRQRTASVWQPWTPDRREIDSGVRIMPVLTAAPQRDQQSPCKWVPKTVSVSFIKCLFICSVSITKLWLLESCMFELERISLERGRTAEPSVAERLSAVNNQSVVSTQTPVATHSVSNPGVTRERDRQLGRQTSLV